MSSAVVLSGAILCWALARGAVSEDALLALVNRGSPWAGLCAASALVLRVVLLVAAPCVLLYRVTMVVAAIVSDRADTTKAGVVRELGLVHEPEPPDC